ncbi:MAG TPA: ABC transporter permease [Candidatus Angelobacter sp.]
MTLLERVQSWFRKKQVSGSLEDELRFHLEKEVELNIVRGMSGEEARRQALIAFGGVPQTREKVRETRWSSGLEALAQDSRYGWRKLAKSPGFTTVAVAMLALGIGGNTAIFTVINSVLLKPLPYPNGDRLVQIQETYIGGSGTASAANFRDWQEQNATFAQLAAYTGANMNLQDIASPERVNAILATASLFDALGARPLLGRTLLAADQESNNPQVAVISAGLWQRRFGADPGLVGKTITLDGQPYTIAGIMPADFRFPDVSEHPTDVWVPLRFTPKQVAQRGNHWLFVIGLMRPGVSPKSALADLKTVAKRLEAQYPEQAKRSVQIRALREYWVGSAGSALFALLGAVGLVLLIACANLANLLLARGAGRKREIAVRMALGASPGRVRRQFFTESLLLALAGGIAGAVVASAGVKALTSLAAHSLPRVGEVKLDLPVFFFLFGVSLLSGIIFGLAPALESSSVRFHDSLKATGVTSRHVSMKLRNALMVAEVALSLVLLVGAGLLIRTFYNLRNTDPGFVVDNVLTLHLSVPEKKYPGETVATGFYQPLLEKIKALPGVQSAGIISLLPIQDAWRNGAVRVEGRPVEEPGHETWAEIRTVSPDYFPALGIGLRQGRSFSEGDTSAARSVLLINDRLAKLCFPGEDPIGKRILFGSPWTIVGAVSDVKQVGLATPTQPELYFPYLQAPEELHGSMTLVVRSRVSPESVVGAVRDSVRSLDPGQPVYDVETMQQVIADSIADRRLYMILLGVFAGIALLLAVVGIYGVISFLVAQRTTEFGIRLALGAPPNHVLAWVLKQSLKLIFAGIALGLVGSFAATRVLGAFLFHVKATDPGTFAAFSLLLGGIALAATYVPAWRATRIDPMVALRHE